MGEPMNRKQVSVFELCCIFFAEDPRSSSIIFPTAMLRSEAGISRMLVSEKLFLSMLIWTTVAMLISLSAGLEVFATLELIGLLIVRELTDGFLTRDMKHRMDLFIYAGLVLFVVIVTHRVWLVLS